MNNVYVTVNSATTLTIKQAHNVEFTVLSGKILSNVQPTESFH